MTAWSCCTSGNRIQLKVTPKLVENYNQQITFKTHFVGSFCSQVVFWSSGRSSPAELPIHQPGQLKAFGSTYTTSDFLNPSLPFDPCHFLYSLATRPLPLPLGLWPHFCFFSLHSVLFPFSLHCCPPFPSGTITLPFPPSRVWAVKQERAHGRPLTGRLSESELSCRSKRLQTLAHICS